MVWAFGAVIITLSVAAVLVLRSRQSGVSLPPLTLDPIVPPPSEDPSVLETDELTPPTAPGRRTLGEEDSVMGALGLVDTLPATGLVPVLATDQALLPGQQFTEKEPLVFKPNTHHLFTAAKATNATWVAVVAMRQEHLPPSTDNLFQVACLVKVDQWRPEMALTGLAVEPADLEFRDKAGGMEATYTLRPWMTEVNQNKTRIEALAGLLQTERAQNPVSWLATHGGPRLGLATQQHLEEGAASLVDALMR